MHHDIYVYTTILWYFYSFHLPSTSLSESESRRSRLVSVLKDPSRRKSSNKKVSFNANPPVVHLVELFDSDINLDPALVNGSPERDLPPPLEPIHHRSIFLTDAEDPELFEQNLSETFNRYRNKKCPTPPRQFSNTFDSNSSEAIMSDHDNDNMPALEPAGEAAEAPKKNQKPKEPPVTFREFDVSLIIIIWQGFEPLLLKSIYKSPLTTESHQKWLFCKTICYHFHNL